MASCEIQGYKVLPLRFSSSSSSYHNIFLKEHSVRLKDESKLPGQTLFLLNVPPYVTEESLAHLFSSAGQVQQVIFDVKEDSIMKNDGFKKAYIVFNSRESLLKALKLTNLNVLSSNELPLKTGIGKWIEEYNESIGSSEEFEQKINEFMSNYDENEKSNKIEVTDDDGWTVVTKGGRKPGLSRKESVVNKVDAKSEKKMKKRELKNFYTFQIRESQMKNIAELRKHYEEAKNKVKLMKATRKFKPY